MAKNKISEFSSTPSNNTDIAGINIAEGCAPSGINNAIRELMAQLKDQQAGTDGDNFAVGGNATVAGTLTVTGASTFTGIPSGPTATSGTNTTQLATTAFVQQAELIGEIKMWGTATAPTGYLLCAGAAVSRTTYAALFTVIGTAFGIGDGSTTFNLPNYVNRTPMGAGGLYAVAATGGSKDAIVVSHTHTVTDPGHAHSYNRDSLDTLDGGGFVRRSGTGADANTTTTATTGVSIVSSGVSGTDANLPPYIGINFIIKT